jgi:HSP20 family protein
MVDRYTRAVGQPRAGSQEVIATRDWASRVDIIETDKAFMIKAEIPEVNKEDVRVTVDNGILTIRGERKQEVEEKGKKSIESSDNTGSSPAALHCPTM